MSISRAKVTEGGRIVIPSAIRKRLGIEIGETLDLEVQEDNSLRILTRKQSLRLAQELFRIYVPEGISLVDELIADRRKEAANE